MLICCLPDRIRERTDAVLFDAAHCSGSWIVLKRGAVGSPLFCVTGRNCFDRTDTYLQGFRLRRTHGARRAGRQPFDRQGRDLRHHRLLRRRQVHARAMHQSARAADLRLGHSGRKGNDRALREGAAAGAQKDRHDLSAFQSDAVAHRIRKRRVSAARQRPFQRADRGQGAQAARAGRHRRQGGGVSETALRRPEAARCHRAGTRKRPECAAVR